MHLLKTQIQGLLDCESDIVDITLFINKLYELCEIIDLGEVESYEIEDNKLSWEDERFFDI